LDTDIHAVTHRSLKSEATNTRSEQCVWLIHAHAGNDVIPIVAKKPIGNRAKYEVLVYHDILKPYNLPAPTLYHSIFNESYSCYWIFISYSGPSLIQFEADPWCRYRQSICESIALVHWTFRDKNIEQLFPWLRVNRSAKLSSADVSEVQSHLRKVAELGIDLPEAFPRHHQQFVERLPCLASLINNLPRTLVHGDFGTFNMVSHGERVLLYDWEGASLQPAVRDLVSLTHRQGIFDIDAIVDAYVQARQRLGESAQKVEQLRYQCDIYHLWELATILAGIVKDAGPFDSPYVKAMLHNDCIFNRVVELLKRTF
jgi:hypothetical protein